MNQDSLNDLLTGALKGDELAENELLERLRERFVKTAKLRYRLNDAAAEDIAQQASVIIWQKYRRETFEQGFLAWAFGVLRNSVRNQVSKDQRENEKRIHYLQNKPIDTEPMVSFSFLVALRECVERITRAGRRYAPTLALIIGNKTKAEICKMLGMSDAAFDTNYCRARRDLRECLAEKGVLE